MIWHGYFILKRETLGDQNWVDLNVLVDVIQTNGQRASYQLIKVTTLDGNMALYEGRYADGAVDFDKFAQKLASAFGVDIANIDIAVGQDAWGNVRATYSYNSTPRFSITLLGCPSENNLCDWWTGAVEACVYKARNIAAWEVAI